MRRIETQRLSDGVLVSYRDMRLMRAVVRAAEKVQGSDSYRSYRAVWAALDAFNAIKAKK